jgi:hypothetical protein
MISYYLLWNEPTEEMNEKIIGLLFRVTDLHRSLVRMLNLSDKFRKI